MIYMAALKEKKSENASKEFFSSTKKKKKKKFVGRGIIALTPHSTLLQENKS